MNLWERRLALEGVRDVVVGADGGSGAVAGRADHLARGVGANVARGEYAGDVRLHPVVHLDVASGVHLDELVYEARVRAVADEDEHGRDREVAELVGLRVAN